MKRYQLNRLSRGKATSLAPSMIGHAGSCPARPGMLAGMRKKKIITTPCMVNSLL